LNSSNLLIVDLSDVLGIGWEEEWVVLMGNGIMGQGRDLVVVFYEYEKPC